MSLSEKFYKGYGHSPVHLLNKCETGDKTEGRAMRKQNSVRLSLFLLSMSDILCFRKEWYCPCGQWYCSVTPHSNILFAHKLAKRIPLGVSRISLRSNITRHRRIELAWYSDKSITPKARPSFFESDADRARIMEQTLDKQGNKIYNERSVFC